MLTVEVCKESVIHSHSPTSVFRSFIFHDFFAAPSELQMGGVRKFLLHTVVANGWPGFQWLLSYTETNHFTSRKYFKRLKSPPPDPNGAWPYRTKNAEKSQKPSWVTCVGYAYLKNHCLHCDPCSATVALRPLQDFKMNACDTVG